MSITAQEAIHKISLGLCRSTDLYNRALSYDYTEAAAEFKRMMEAEQMAIDALREKAERENPQPLTLEELRQMDGEPVWIDDWWEDSHGWELSMDAADYFEGERRTEKEYGSIWVAYRHKPKEDGND